MIIRHRVSILHKVRIRIVTISNEFASGRWSRTKIRLLWLSLWLYLVFYGMTDIAVNSKVIPEPSRILKNKQKFFPCGKFSFQTLRGTPALLPTSSHLCWTSFSSVALIITPSELGARSILVRGFYFRKVHYSLTPPGQAPKMTGF